MERRLVLLRSRRLSAAHGSRAPPALLGRQLLHTYPRDLGHLYRGAQLLVVGRYRQPGPRVTSRSPASSATRPTPRAFAFDVNFPGHRDAERLPPRLCATRKIGYLLDEIAYGERTELREEVVTLSRRFGIVTPYTSYLVAPDSEMQGINVPVLSQPTTTTTGGTQFSLGNRGQGQTAARPAPAAAPADGVGVGVARLRGLRLRQRRACAALRRRLVRRRWWQRPAGSAVRSLRGMGDRRPAVSRRGCAPMREAERTDTDDAMTSRFVAGRTFNAHRRRLDRLALSPGYAPRSGSAR